MTIPGDLTQSPTVLSPAPTLSGVILGTAAYMSPEQARGRAVDTRSDVWAFGCVLFEMLAGKKVFDGETLTDAIAAISRASLTGGLCRPERRHPSWRSSRGASERSGAAASRHHRWTVPNRRCAERSRRSWHDGVCACWEQSRADRVDRDGATLSVALFFAIWPSNSAPSSEAISFSVFPPEKTAFSGSVNTTVNVPSFALSPDGKALVFSAQSPGAKPTLWLRSLDSLGARQLAGTDDAQDPIWSPDSRWIGFFADGKLKKVSAAGGAVQIIAQTATDFRGGTWSPDGTILFSSGTDPIVSVNAAGGKTTPVTTFDKTQQEAIHRNPQFLPDGRHFLYSIMGRRDDQNGVYAGSLDGQTKKFLLPVNTSAVYVPPGYLLFADGDSLLAQAFNAARLEPIGQPFLVAEDGGRDTAFMSAVSASRTGVIAYAGIISQAGRLHWLDRAGTRLAPAGTPDGDYTDFRLSHDETRLAASSSIPRPTQSRSGSRTSRAAAHRV